MRPTTRFMLKKISIKNAMLALMVVVGTFAFAGVSQAANKTWVSTGSNSWNTSGNWSPSGVPNSSSNVIFSSSSTVNCNIDAAANVAQITIASTYTGTITQNSGETITVGASGFSQAAGTFTGSASAGDSITINGTFSLTGGIFTSTKDWLYIVATTTFSGGTFNNNSGTVEFSQPGVVTTTIGITGSSTFYNLAIGDWRTFGNMTVTLSAGTVITVQNWFFTGTEDDYLIFNGGEIDVAGNIIPGLDNNPLGSPSAGTTVFKLTGSGTQTVGDAATGVSLGFYYGDPSQFVSLALPNLTINKPSGGVTLSSFGGTSGTIYILGNWTNTSNSVITPGTSSVVLASYQYGTDGATTSTPGPTITGTSTFYSFAITSVWPNAEEAQNPGVVFTVATGTTITVNGELDYFVTGSMLSFGGGGEIDAKGDISTMGSSANTWWGGSDEYIPTSTFNLVINGTGTQNIGGNGFYDLWLQTFNDAKASGTVNFVNGLYVAGNYTNSAGPLGITAASSSLVIFGSASGTITGSTTFYELGFGYPGNLFNNNLTITTGTVLTAQSSTVFSMRAAVPTLLGGGEIDAQGDVLREYPWALDGALSGLTYPTNTFNFVMDGTSTQTIDDEGLSYYDPVNGSAPFWLQGLTINKSSGVVVVSSTYTAIPSNLKILQGELQLSGGQYFEIDGSSTISSGGILSDYAQATSTILLGNSVTNNGLIFFAGDGIGCAAPLPNYVMIQSTVTNTPRTWSGSGNYIMRYVSIQDQTGPTSPTVSVLNGTSVGTHNSNWVFVTAARPQLVQSASSTSASNVSTLALPAFGFKPRAGDLILVAVSVKNQSLAAPTDNAGNTYTLAASSSFGSSPSYAVGLYYAKNIVTSSSLTVTVNGASSLGSQLISGAAFEYTGMAPSSTFAASSTYASSPATTTAITSQSAAGTSLNSLYFGATTFAASTTLTSDPAWTARAGIVNNTVDQALYTEEIATTTASTLAAAWTAATGTTFGAVVGVFRSPYTVGYAATGTVDSATFDTKVASGTQLNSVIWQGNALHGTSVGFQFAVSGSSAGPWVYKGPGGTSNGTDVFSGAAGTPIPLVSSPASAGGYNLFNGYRYFRYRVTLFSDLSQTYSPVVSQVIVNWSP